ncbi:MAG: sulfate reduction electron transfer complex DsrMKJOP subunit DsrM [Nitrospirae bacterium]|nr:sulfate reduction electron transfer complex DsrMKJOP subunit DsrM [Nitrospirota bacterium]
MKVFVPLVAVAAIFLLALILGGIPHLQFLIGVVIPYAAIIIFIAGFVARIMDWFKSPVPFCIPTTCGQQKTLPWIKNNELENPSKGSSVIMRMALEVLLFRSLFRNTFSEIRDGRLVHSSRKWLWLGAIVFHATFFTVLLRHMRLFVEPVPRCLHVVELLDSFMQIGTPILYMSGVILLLATVYLFARRIHIPQVKYISLPADYFPLFLIFAIALSGIFMRYFTKVDIVGVKQFIMGLVTLSPRIQPGIGTIFYAHLLLVCTLLAYFPFSKLMHAGGVFFSPTRNMANNSRIVRHINPWNYKVKVHTYEEYEDEFREKMRKAGLPLDKE